MITINRIVEPESYLYKDNQVVGVINNHLELNDVLIQIKNKSLNGYKVKYEDDFYEIRNDGRIINGSVVYPILSKQLREMIGF
jgi:hypothetical protein